MKQSTQDWIIIGAVILGILFCIYKAVQGQEYEVITTTTTAMYEYDGWQHKTTLRSDSWDASQRPPEPNERLYIYKDGIKQKGYYEWDGYQWKPKQGAYTNKYYVE